MRTTHDLNYDFMHGQIGQRGYCDNRNLAGRYADQNEIVEKLEKQLASAMRGLNELRAELDVQFPATSREAKEQLSVELFCWADGWDTIPAGDRKAVLKVCAALKRGATISFGAVDTIIRESMPEGLWEAVTAE